MVRNSIMVNKTRRLENGVWGGGETREPGPLVENEKGAEHIFLCAQKKETTGPRG